MQIKLCPSNTFYLWRLSSSLLFFALILTVTIQENLYVREIKHFVSERNRYLIALVLSKTVKKKTVKKYNKKALKVHILPIVFEREIIAKEKKVILSRVSAPYLVSKLLLVN